MISGRSIMNIWIKKSALNTFLYEWLYYKFIILINKFACVKLINSRNPLPRSTPPATWVRSLLSAGKFAFRMLPRRSPMTTFSNLLLMLASLISFRPGRWRALIPEELSSCSKLPSKLSIFTWPGIFRKKFKAGRSTPFSICTLPRLSSTAIDFTGSLKRSRGKLSTSSRNMAFADWTSTTRSGLG